MVDPAAAATLFTFDNSINLGQIIITGSTIAGGLWAIFKTLGRINGVGYDIAAIKLEMNDQKEELKKITQILVSIAETRAILDAVKGDNAHLKEEMARLRDEMSRFRTP